MDETNVAGCFCNYFHDFKFSFTFNFAGMEYLAFDEMNTTFCCHLFSFDNVSICT